MLFATQLHRDRVCIVQPDHEYFGNRLFRAQQSFGGPLGIALDEDGKGYKRFLLPPTQSRIAQRRLRRKNQQQQQLAVATFDSMKDIKPGASSSSENLLGFENSSTSSAAPGSSVASAAAAENESKNLSSSSESSSESEEEALADGFRFASCLALCHPLVHGTHRLTQCAHILWLSAIRRKPLC